MVGHVVNGLVVVAVRHDVIGLVVGHVDIGLVVVAVGLVVVGNVVIGFVGAGKDIIWSKRPAPFVQDPSSLMGTEMNRG